MRYIVKCMPERTLFVKELKEQIPELELCQDKYRNAMETFLRSLQMSKDDAVVHMEDDIVLCDDFKQKVEAIIEKNPNSMIQFFSMRKDDIEVGTRWVNGSRFMCNCCVYYPPKYSRMLLEYSKTWSRYEEHPTGTDTMVSDFLASRKESYLNICPNMVDHRQVKSLINPRRSSKRISKTFKK